MKLNSKTYRSGGKLWVKECTVCRPLILYNQWMVEVLCAKLKPCDPSEGGAGVKAQLGVQPSFSSAVRSASVCWYVPPLLGKCFWGLGGAGREGVHQSSTAWPIRVPLKGVTWRRRRADWLRGATSEDWGTSLMAEGEASPCVKQPEVSTHLHAGD